MKLTFEKIRTLSTALTLGKEQLISIVDNYVEDNTNLREDLYSEVEHIILTIGDRSNVDSFSLHDDLRLLFTDIETFNDLSKSLNYYMVLDDNFGYCFMYHCRNILNEIDTLTDRLNSKSTIHNYMKLTPKQPEEYANISDTNTIYNSVMSKLSLKNYNKYVNDSDDGASAWTFQVSMTYLIIIDKLYRIMIDNIDNPRDFFFRCVTSFNPIITGLSYTADIDLGNVYALELLYELYQLTSTGSHLTIKKNQDTAEVQFIYTTENGTFTSAEYESTNAIFRRDTSGKRKVILTITGTANNLHIKVDIVGLQAIHDITGLACNKELFSLNTDELQLEAMTYFVIGVMLSHTVELQTDFTKFKRHAKKLVNSGKYRSIFDTPKYELIESATCQLMRKHVFESLKHETQLRPLLALQKQFDLKRFAVIYYRYVVSAMTMTDIEISEMLKPIGSKQQALIRRMISFIKSFDYKGIPALHLLYKKVTYRS